MSKDGGLSRITDVCEYGQEARQHLWSIIKGLTVVTANGQKRLIVKDVVQENGNVHDEDVDTPEVLANAVRDWNAFHACEPCGFNQPHETCLLKSVNWFPVCGRMLRHWSPARKALEEMGWITKLAELGLAIPARPNKPKPVITPVPGSSKTLHIVPKTTEAPAPSPNSTAVDLNLNHAKLVDGTAYGRRLQDYGGQITSLPGVELIFRDHEERLLDLLPRYPIVVGNIAWLTSEKILRQLPYMEGVCIVVQKEDTWRPDLNWGPDFYDWRPRLQENYRAIPQRLRLREFDYPICELATDLDQLVDPLRCVGVKRGPKDFKAARAHNKFLIFCRRDQGMLAPLAVWTGSYNLSANSRLSFENSLFIQNEEVADKFYLEFCQILALSEPLQWKQNCLYPQWRLDRKPKLALVKSEIA